MTTDLKIYFALVCVPAAVITALGIALLHRQGQRECEVAASADRARAEALAADLQEALRDAPPDARDDVLAKWAPPEGAAPVAARFRWSPGGRVRPLSAGFPAPLAERAGAISKWNGWTTPGRRVARRGLMALDAPPPAHVLWARVDDSIYAAAFARAPLAPSPTSPLWPAGLVMAALLAGTVAAGGALLWRAAAKARRDDLTKTDFLSNVSHELRTPLATIRVWSDLLRGGKPLTDAQRARAVAAISSENDRMLRLVQDLLDSTRPERRALRARAVDVDLAQLVRDTVAGLAGSLPGGAELDLPAAPLAVRTDPDAVAQILLNLVGNARKYAPGAAVEISLAAAGPGAAELRVADRGPGMSAEALRRCFERFYREHDELDAGVGGLGLGLPISRALARELGGELAAAARPGGGCVFTLTLRSLV